MDLFKGLKTITTLNGSLGRLQYLVAWILVSVLASILVAVLGMAGLISFLATLAMLSTTVKRLHHIGWSGWLSLLTLIPGLGLIFAVVLLFVPGK